MEQIRIALLGYGTVGKGVADLIEMNREILKKNCDKELIVKKILVRNKERHKISLETDNRFTTDFEEIINDENIDILVEVMGGIHPAVDYMARGLEKKKHIVTANKMALAIEGEALFELAKKQDCHLFYEASVGGAIPVIRQVNESLNGNQIKSVEGIMNGTSNYMLTKMSKEGMGFEEALKIAQDLGYAEADPTADVGGYDTLYKLVVLSSLAFQTKVDYKKVYREGIEQIGKRDIEFAQSMGYAIKLLAIGKEENGQLELRVHPTMLPLTHPLACIDDVYNGFCVTGNAAGDIVTSGRGAGALPTASAVVSDLLAVAKEAPQDYLIVGEKSEKPIQSIEDVKIGFYIRLTIVEEPGVLKAVTDIFEDKNIVIDNLVQEKISKGIADLCLLTGETYEKEVNEAIFLLKQVDSVQEINSKIRITS